MKIWGHAIAVASGLACFAILYRYTGDADILVAITSGLAVSAISYLAAYLALALHRTKH